MEPPPLLEAAWMWESRPTYFLDVPEKKRGFDRRRLLSSHKLFLMRRWQRYWARFSFQQQQLILLERAVPPCSYSISKHHKTRRRSMEVKAISTTLKVSKGTVPRQNWAEKWGREMMEDLYQDLRQPDSWDIFILCIVFIFRFWDFQRYSQRGQTEAVLTYMYRGETANILVGCWGWNWQAGGDSLM